MNNVGKRIYEERIKKNMTQEELAEKIDSVPSYISNIERNNKCPSLKFLSKIVNALDTTYDVLLIDDFDKNKKIEIEHKDILREISQLDEEIQYEYFKLSNQLIRSLKNIKSKKK